MEDVMQDKSLGRGKPCSPVKQASFLTEPDRLSSRYELSHDLHARDCFLS